MNGYLNAIALTVDYMIEGETPTNMDHLKEDVIAAIKRDEAKDKENAALKTKIEAVSGDALSNFYQNIELKARVAELEGELNTVVAGLHSKSDINKIKAEAIREAVKENVDIGVPICGFVFDVCYHDTMMSYARNLERGES